jgi:hypothetical protein
VALSGGREDNYEASSGTSNVRDLTDVRDLFASFLFFNLFPIPNS